MQHAAQLELGWWLQAPTPIASGLMGLSTSPSASSGAADGLLDRLALAFLRQKSGFGCFPAVLGSARSGSAGVGDSAPHTCTDAFLGCRVNNFTRFSTAVPNKVDT